MWKFCSLARCERRWSRLQEVGKRERERERELWVARKVVQFPPIPIPSPILNPGIPFRCTCIYHRATIIKLLVLFLQLWKNFRIFNVVYTFPWNTLFYSTHYIASYINIWESIRKTCKLSSRNCPLPRLERNAREIRKRSSSTTGKQKWPSRPRDELLFQTRLFRFKRPRVAIAISATRWKTFGVNFYV